MRLRQRVSSKWLASAAAHVALAVPAAGFAVALVATPASAAPVVQALPSADQTKLNAALARLGRDPRDVSALIDAGDAARRLGDFDAAIGFYRRADEISAGNARVKAGLAASLAQSGDPVAALPLFAEAERAGASPTSLAVDRGLAYDLVGDNATAQRYYAMALGGASDEDVRMRLSISQAIAGDAQASETTIMPLLRKQDKPGWRTRAFALAIAGDTKQAVEVSNTILPPQLAQNIAPYLRYMPRLTRAQQAAAANLGKFPRASEIGHDDARIAAYKPVQVASADANLVPRGEALGSGKAPDRPSRTTRTGGGSKAGPKTGGASIAVADPYRLGGTRTTRSTPSAVKTPEPARVAPPEPKPTIERDGATGELPPLASATPGTSPVSTPVSASTSAPVAAKPATTPPAAASSLPPGFDPRAVGAAPVHTAAASPISNGASPGFDLTRSVPAQGTPAMPAPQSSTPAPRPVPEPTAPVETPPEPGAQQLSLAQIFADIGKPTMQSAPASGAVDIRQIEPARPAPPKIVPPKPEPEAPKVVEKAPAKVDPKAKPDPKAKVGAKVEADDEDKPTGKAAPKTRAEIAKAKAEAAKAEAAKTAKAKKPAPPSHPSRIWVQIGVGRDKAAIAFDWRRYNKQAPALFKGREPYVSEMGRTNRILIGPFATQKAASGFMADARKQGFSDALPWTSPAGQVVDALSAK